MVGLRDETAIGGSEKAKVETIIVVTATLVRQLRDAPAI